MVDDDLDYKEWHAVHKQTGEVMEFDLFSIKEGGSWKKIFVKEFCSMLGLNGAKCTKVLAYMIEGMNTKNEFHGTQREVAEKLGTTTATVSKMIVALKKGGHIKEVRSGCYIFDTKSIQYGNVGNKIAVLRVWNNLI